MRLRTALASLPCALSLLLLTACGGSTSDAASEEGSPEDRRTLEQLWRAPGADVAFIPGTSSHEPGQIRVSFLVTDAQNQPITLPTAKVWLARGLEERPFLTTTAQIERIGVPGGAGADSTHIYVAHLRVPKPGTYWMLAEPEGGRTDVQALGNVVVDGALEPPGVGDPAPASETPTLRRGGDAASLTTRRPPDVALLQHSVAESVRAKRPFVVVFATPKFCASRTCAPVVDVVEEVAHRQAGSPVRFIHAEVYEGNDPAKGYNRWMHEWGLTTEPWTFVVGADGRVSDGFEGPVSVRELEDAVRKVSDE